jgi:hypothetical protein
MSIVGSHEVGLHISQGAQVASQKSTGREDIAGSSPDLPPLSKGLEIEISDFETENAMLEGDYLWQVVGIVNGGISIILEVRYMCLFMTLGGILWEGNILTNLCHTIRYYVNLQKLKVGM